MKTNYCSAAEVNNFQVGEKLTQILSSLVLVLDIIINLKVTLIEYLNLNTVIKI